jgi:hypothetical protein
MYRATILYMNRALVVLIVAALVLFAAGLALRAGQWVAYGL